MKISDLILEKLQAAVEQAGSAKEFARTCRISQSNISRYLSGDTRTISEENWEKLAPFIGISPKIWQQQGIMHTPQLADFLKAELQQAGFSFADLPALLLAPPLLIEEIVQQHILWPPELLAALLDIMHADREKLPISAAERQHLPVSGVFAAGAAVMRLLPVRELGSGIAADHVAEEGENQDTFAARIPVPADLRSDTKAFRIGDDQLSPLLQKGDVVLTINTLLQELPEGKIVVAAIIQHDGSEKLVCRRYFPRNEHFFILKGAGDDSEPMVVQTAELKWVALAVRRISTL